MSVEEAAPEDGYGDEPSQDDELWRAAGAAMTPGDTLTRISTNARATVTAVALVGTVLTGVGVISSQTLLAVPLPRLLALGAVVLAVLAVLLALVYLGLRLEVVNPHNLVAVERFYRKQFARAWLAVVSSWMLLLAVLLGAAAGIVGVVLAGSPSDPTLGLAVSGEGDSRRLDVRVDAAGLDSGSQVTVRVTAVASPGCPERTVLDGRYLADRTGKLGVSSTVNGLPCNQSFRLAVSGAGIHESGLTVP